MPIAESPSYHGYDVSDYNEVDREYGANDDFKQLIAEAHRRGIRVIVDLVLNHTSSQHPWFAAAQDPASPKRDWYIWSNEEPQGPGWHKSASGWYYGYFGKDMPDLNYRNEAVTAAMHDVARSWLEEMGADGFRLDAVKYLIEDGRRIENTPATHDWLEGLPCVLQRRAAGCSHRGRGVEHQRCLGELRGGRAGSRVRLSAGRCDDRRARSTAAASMRSGRRRLCWPPIRPGSMPPSSPITTRIAPARA